jgi:hypothetical protein
MATCIPILDVSGMSLERNIVASSSPLSSALLECIVYCMRLYPISQYLLTFLTILLLFNCRPNKLYTISYTSNSNIKMSKSQTFDALIICGGPAGLPAAYGLARLLHSVVLFDSGVYRNARSSHMHVVPTWDHRDSKDFRAAARKDLLCPIQHHSIPRRQN